MPIIEVKMWEGRSRDQKKSLIKGITEAVMAACGCPKEAVQVIISDYNKDNWGLAGEQASDVR